MVYIKKSIKFKVPLQECKDFIEHIWMEIQVNNKKIIIGNIYRPPNSDIDLFISHLDNVLSDCFVNSDGLILLEDLNINMLNEDSKTTSLYNITELFDLVQHIREPTRISDKHISLIDLIFSNMNIKNAGIRYVQIMDHMGIHCDIDISLTNPPENSFSYRQLNYINKNQFLEDLASGILCTI